MNFDHSLAGVHDPERLCGSPGQVDDAARDPWTAIIDAYDDAASAVPAAHFDERPEG
jgi:hypothetical protein